MVERMAICCPAAINAETMTRFIQSQEERDAGGTNDDGIQLFALVDSIGDYSGGPGKSVDKPSAKNSPFTGKSPEECLDLLKRVKQATTDDSINLEFFAMMDERSNDDDTVLVVNAKYGFKSVRATFSFCINAMFCWMTGHRSVDDDIGQAQGTEDKVLRN